MDAPRTKTTPAGWEVADLCVLFWEVTGLRPSMIIVDGLHSVDLGTGAHIVGNIFLEKLRHMGAKNMGDNVTILDRQVRAWNQVHNPNVSRRSDHQQAASLLGIRSPKRQQPQ